MFLLINDISLIFITLGTFIGAGFASGKEILSFFVKYGYLGFCGIFLTTSILIFIYYKTVLLAIKYNAKSFSEIISTLFPKHIFFSSFIIYCTNIFLIISFLTMVSGFAAFCSQEFNMPKFFGTLIIILINFFILFFDISGLKKINIILIPFIMLFILILFAKNCTFNCYYPQSNTSVWFIVSSILYASYNSIVLVPTILSSKLYLSKKNAIFSSVILFIVIFCLLSILFILLCNNYIHIINLEIPLMFIASKQGLIYQLLCIFMILFSILTSAFSAVYSLLCDIAKNRKQYLIYLCIISILGFFSMFFNFSYLVEYIYPVCGVFGLIQIFFLLNT